MFKNEDIQIINGPSGPLYLVGNAEILDMPMISVSGTREIDWDSQMWLEDKISQIKNHVIVSGLALGTDTHAHHFALNYGLPTIAILPTGVNNITPYRNTQLAEAIVEKGGALISAYHPKQGIDSYKQYHDRNRLIAQCGKLLIVPQFNSKSGTRSTVDSAQKFGKCIVVQDADYSGNQEIINSDKYITISP